MKTRLALGSALLASFASAASAQHVGPFVSEPLSPSAEFSLATAAAPSDVTGQAAVYVYARSGYELARPGTNGFTCLVNRDAFLDGYEALKPTCFDAEGTRTLVPMVLRVGEQLAHGVDSAEIRRDIDLRFHDGRLSPPRRFGVAYMAAGDVTKLDSAGQIVAHSAPHLMFYALEATNGSLGIEPRAARTAGAPYVFRRSEYYAFLIVPLPKPSNEPMSTSTHGHPLGRF